MIECHLGERLQKPFKRRRWILIGTVIGIVVAGAVGGSVVPRLSNGGFTDPRLAEGFKGDIRRNATFRHTWSHCGVEPRAFAEPNGEE